MQNILPSDTEIKNVIKEEYGLNIISVELIKSKLTDKERFVFKVSTHKASFCFKKVYYDEGSLLFIYSITAFLNKNNIKTPEFIPTLNRGRYISFDNMLFILTPWIDGVKSTFSKEENMVSILKNLAEIHASSINFSPIEGSTVLYGEFDLANEFDRHTTQILDSINRSYFRGDAMSIQLQNTSDSIYRCCSLSCETAKGINLNNLSRGICHNDYVNKNIIFKDDLPWAIDLDNCKIDYFASDLGYFFRRFLRNRSVKWDFNSYISLIRDYESINKLNFDDHKYLLSYLTFPQKQWRLLNSYYRKNPSIDYSDYKKSMSYTNKHIKNKLKFIYNYKEYIDNRFSNY